MMKRNENVLMTGRNIADDDKGKDKAEELVLVMPTEGCALAHRSIFSQLGAAIQNPGVCGRRSNKSATQPMHVHIVYRPVHACPFCLPPSPCIFLLCTTLPMSITQHLQVSAHACSG